MDDKKETGTPKDTLLEKPDKEQKKPTVKDEIISNFIDTVIDVVIDTITG